MNHRGLATGLAAALTFAVATPGSVSLLAHLDVQVLAGALYAGALLFMIPVRLVAGRSQAAWSRRDLPRVGIVAVAGGVVAPVLLLYGLDHVGGVTGSLLLNLEGPFTLVLAVAVFGERLGRVGVTGVVVVLVGAAIVAASGATGAGSAGIGVLAIAGACALWAWDNNLSADLVARRPVDLVMVKAGVAALVNLVIASGRGQFDGVEPRWWWWALALGACSYGLSLVLDAWALRELGAAREAGLLATSPFLGAALSVPILGDTPSGWVIVAGLVMAVGVVLLGRDDHGHPHRHDAATHDHSHRHDDDHHEHAHDEPESADVGMRRHRHAHDHTPTEHSHRHTDGSDHRHDHD